MPLWDETHWCPGLRQAREAQLGTFGLQLLPGVPWGAQAPSLIRLDDHLVSIPALVGPQVGGMVGTEVCKKEGALHC